MTPPAPEASPRISGQSNGEVSAQSPTHLVVGRILAPWGYRGQVRAEILTDFPERFARLREIAVGEAYKPYRLLSARLHKGGVILQLEGVDSPEKAAELRGKFLYVPISEAMPLPEGTYYQHQILGLEVYTTSGDLLGSVTEILETGANDVYVVRNGGREVLIPALADVVEYDLEHHRLVVALPPGLLEEEEA